MRADDAPPPRGLGRRAAGLELALVLATVVLVAALGVPADVGRDEWLGFAALVPLVVGAHLLGADRARHQGSHFSLAPILAAVLILPPALVVAAIALAFLPEWLRNRADWYIVVFNVCNFVFPALVARAVFDAVGEAAWALGAAAAIGAFLTLHYGLLASVLRLARSVAVRDTVRLDCLLVDAGLLSLGAIAAALWEEHPGLLGLTVVPLALAYRSLSIPALVEATRIEPKTGLYNLRHLCAALAQELERAARFDRSVALLMVDVDRLREINTSRGHLAGDRALVAVADALRATTREYDLAARFGGDQFCVLLPETELEGALVVAERMRATVEEACAADLRVTISVGAVAHRGGGVTPDDLIARADRAAYRAKSAGRNAVAVPPPVGPVGEAERLLLDALDGTL